MKDEGLIHKLALLIQDSDEYCAIYGSNPPVLYAMAIPHLRRMPRLEGATIAWQKPDGTIMTMRQRLSEIATESLPALTETDSLNDAVQVLAHASDEAIATMLARHIRDIGLEEVSCESVVFATTVWSIDPTSIFLTHDEAADELEAHRDKYGPDARITTLPLKAGSLLARLIGSITSWTND